MHGLYGGCITGIPKHEIKSLNDLSPVVQFKFNFFFISTLLRNEMEKINGKINNTQLGHLTNVHDRLDTQSIFKSGIVWRLESASLFLIRTCSYRTKWTVVVVVVFSHKFSFSLQFSLNRRRTTSLALFSGFLLRLFVRISTSLSEIRWISACGLWKQYFVRSVW